MKHPGRLLIGLDVNANTALVLPGRRGELHTASDLIQVIRAKGENS